MDMTIVKDAGLDQGLESLTKVASVLGNDEEIWRSDLPSFFDSQLLRCISIAIYVFQEDVAVLRMLVEAPQLS